MKVVIVGGVAGGATAAARIRRLAQEGYDCYNFSGGYRFYERVTSENKLSDYSYPCGMSK